MDIKINRISKDVYDLMFDTGGVRLGVEDIKVLRAALDRVLEPENAAKERTRHRAFMAKLAGADDAGIQALLRRAPHDDVLVLLAVSEEMEALKRRLYGNMTDKAMKLYMEDLLFKFADGVPEGQLTASMAQLMDTARKLEQDGVLTFSARRRPAAREPGGNG